MVYEIRDPRPLMPLFGPWKETMLYSCFQGVMGKLYADSSLAPGGLWLSWGILPF